MPETEPGDTTLPDRAAAEVAVLAATPGILEALLSPVTATSLRWKPSPERWSVAEVLGHLVDVEERNLGLRVRRIATEELPSLVDYDQNLEYARGTYSSRSGDEQLRRFQEVRGASLDLLRSLAATALDRRGLHPAVGEVEIRQLLALWAFHDLSHIRQIAELVKATTFWEGIGSLQVYYGVHP